MKARQTKSRKTAKPHPMPVDALVYPRFSGVPTFMRLPHIPRRRGTGPGVDRHSFRWRHNLPSGRALRTTKHSRAIGHDPALESGAENSIRSRSGASGISAISRSTRCRLKTPTSESPSNWVTCFATGARTVCVGGDHSILLPILRAIHDTSARLALSSSMPMATPGADISAARIRTARR